LVYNAAVGVLAGAWQHFGFPRTDALPSGRLGAAGRQCGVSGFMWLLGYTCETRSLLKIELVRKPIMAIGPRCRRAIVSCSMI